MAEVAVHAASAHAYGPVSAIEHQIRKLRLALQNGSEARARAHLDQAVKKVRDVPAGVDRRPMRVRAYEAATLLSAGGKKLGEIEEIGPTTATAVVGEWQDTLGFIDFGDTKVPLDSRRLVFGPKGPLGLILVVLADPSVASAEDLTARR